MVYRAEGAPCDLTGFFLRTCEAKTEEWHVGTSDMPFLVSVLIVW